MVMHNQSQVYFGFAVLGNYKQEKIIIEEKYFVLVKPENCFDFGH